MGAGASLRSVLGVRFARRIVMSRLKAVTYKERMSGREMVSSAAEGRQKQGSPPKGGRYKTSERAGKECLCH